MSRSVKLDTETLRERELPYSRGGYIPAREELPTVTTRIAEDGRMEYWDENRHRWMAALTMAEYHALLALPEQELADDYERNDHH